MKYIVITLVILVGFAGCSAFWCIGNANEDSWVCELTK